MWKTRKPQDYVNMERHIWWHQERQRKHDYQELEQLRPPLTIVQIIRIATLLLQQDDTQENPTQPAQTPETTVPEIPNATTHQQAQQPTLWEQLALVVRNNDTSKWKCNIPGCNKMNDHQQNITKHKVKQHKDQ